MAAKQPITATTVPRPALRYFGAKWRLAPWIQQYFPTHISATWSPAARRCSYRNRAQRSRCSIAAADLTDYSPAYLRRLASQERIKARKVGRDWQIHREDLLAFVEHMNSLGNQRHNPWRADLADQGLGRQHKDQ